MQKMLLSAVGIIGAVFVCLAAVRAAIPWLQQSAQNLSEKIADNRTVDGGNRTADGENGAADGGNGIVDGENGAAGADLGGLYSPCAILLDADTGEVLAEKNSRLQSYPASLTKIMTALLVIEYAGNLDESVWMPSDIYDQLYAEGASMAGFLPGEETTLRELLYGILLPSGAECCLTAARYIAGSEDAYVELMNQRASDLGMDNTHFTNCTGLQDTAHYSSPADIAVLLREALQNVTFREIFTSEYYYVQPTEQHPEGFTFWSTLFSQEGSNTDGVILGGKTGYTQEAGLCLASLLSAGGREYILVTMGAPGSHETEPYHIEDALNVGRQLG